ncbi:isoaspartyl peptidase/L-asparaginase [Flaviflagellibacter deserti]|uniref:Isoaspartyl peptidase/L-asparaginase family protein n=1 Tax=Flaviflagellibacter deserti TaxID=2267266 RepID=A0ABV9Z179_9HYPH
MTQPFALVIHGGAFQTESDYSEQYAHMRSVLEAGRAALASGGAALDVAVDAVKRLEDAGLYVAGKGAGPNTAGYYELDASIMDGASGKAGAVAGLTHFRNPIACARTVMDKTRHVMLTGPGADHFLTRHGLETVDPTSYFVSTEPMEAETSHGTVGAVVLDVRGHLVSAVSTGGTSGKLEGRVGDPAIVGASIFAGDDVAVCSTGHGEYFIRNVAAYDVVARCRYSGTPLGEALDATLFDRVKASGGWGGMIAVNAKAEVALAFTDRGMHRGYVTHDRDISVASY